MHDQLLVRVTDHVLAPVVILRAERHRLEAVPAAGLLPILRRRDDRSAHLLCADAVLLLTDDLFDLACDAKAERQPGVQTGGEWPRDRGPQHELRPGRGRVGWRVAQGAAEEGRLFHVMNSEAEFGPRRGRPTS